MLQGHDPKDAQTMTTEPTELQPEALPAGPDGVSVRFALTPRPEAMAAAEALAARFETSPPRGVTEIVPGLVSVLLRFDPCHTRQADLRATALAEARAVADGGQRLPEPARRWTIPAAFGGEDGPQLAELARTLGLSETAAVEEICNAPLRVLTIGFAPGQPYIGLLPERWNIPRLKDLTPEVPAGAVVVAVRQIVLFGQPSTTGWRQAGRAAFRCFRPERETPMPLRAGDAIRFARASADEIAALDGADDGLGGARLEVLG